MERIPYLTFNYLKYKNFHCTIFNEIYTQLMVGFMDILYRHTVRCLMKIFGICNYLLHTIFWCPLMPAHQSIWSMLRVSCKRIRVLCSFVIKLGYCSSMFYTLYTIFIEIKVDWLHFSDGILWGYILSLYPQKH